MYLRFRILKNTVSNLDCSVGHTVISWFYRIDYYRGDYMLNIKSNKRARWISKIFGFALSLSGIFIVAKYQLHLMGLILLVIGIYLAAFLGAKDLQ